MVHNDQQDLLSLSNDAPKGYQFRTEPAVIDELDSSPLLASPDHVHIRLSFLKS